MLVGKPDPEAALEQYVRAHPELTHRLKDKDETPLNITIAEGCRTIIGNLKQSKYIYSILLTGLTQKLVMPQQDIRLVQSGMPDGYSNRSADENFVTPFLKQHGLTSCAASGMESGRNLERPISP